MEKRRGGGARLADRGMSPREDACDIADICFVSALTLGSRSIFGQTAADATENAEVGHNDIAGPNHIRQDSFVTLGGRRS